MGLLEKTIDCIGELDIPAMEQARKRQDELTKPPGSLGRLEELSIQVAGITGNPRPRIDHKAIFVMAGDHGIASEGVSLYPQDVTQQMVQNILSGGAGINVLSRHGGIRVVMTDLGIREPLPVHEGMYVKRIGPGTRNMAKGPAMTRQEAVRSVEAGIEVFEAELVKGLSLSGTGDMGIGNTTASSAITAAITGKAVKEVTGRGTGLSDAQFSMKVKIIEQVLELNKPNPNDGLDVLSKVGGFEIGGIAGVILAAAAHRIPVVIDGFISGAAALIAAVICPKSKAFMIAAHKSVESGHGHILSFLGLSPLLTFNMRLGEGTGAALGIPIVEAAVKILNEMSTFAEAHVSEAL